MVRDLSITTSFVDMLARFILSRRCGLTELLRPNFLEFWDFSRSHTHPRLRDGHQSRVSTRHFPQGLLWGFIQMNEIYILSVFFFACRTICADKYTLKVYFEFNTLHVNLSIPVTAKFPVLHLLEQAIQYTNTPECAGARILTCYCRSDTRAIRPECCV